MPKPIKAISCEQCHCVDRGIFCELGLASKDNVTINKVMNHYKKGQTLFLQGNPAFGIYCINNGKLKITKMANDGNETIVRIAGPGDVLGHQNIFNNEVHAVSATVIEEASVCFIDKAYILKLMNEQPTVAMNIIRKLSKEMSAVEARSAGLSHRNVRERLAELLLDLKSAYGITEGNRCRLDIKLTREEMASMVGTANETIIRFISEFREEGILEQEGKVIFIVNEKLLLKTANLGL